jgi:hypothetical protein
MMIHPEGQVARAIPTEGEEEIERIVLDDGFEVLRPYFREIGPIETLTSEQEIALAKAVDDCTRAVRREILDIPLAARLLVERWSEFRSANAPGRYRWARSGSSAPARCWHRSSVRRRVPLALPSREVIRERSDGQLRAGPSCVASL